MHTTHIQTYIVHVCVCMSESLVWKRDKDHYLRNEPFWMRKMMRRANKKKIKLNMRIIIIMCMSDSNYEPWCHEFADFYGLCQCFRWSSMDWSYIRIETCVTHGIEPHTLFCGQAMLILVCFFFFSFKMWQLILYNIKLNDRLVRNAPAQATQKNSFVTFIIMFFFSPLLFIVAVLQS